MEIKMCTCPNGHYYNADIYSSCPECGAAAAPNPGVGNIPATAPAYNANAPVFGGAQPIEKTMPANAAYGAGPVGVTEPINAPAYGGAQPIGKTMPANASYSNGNPGVTIPVNGRDVPSVGSFGATVSAVDLNAGARATAASEPVVGWLVCVEGPVRGVDFRLHDGYNYIGREEGDIHIQGDNAISRQKHAVVAFYAKRNTFYAGPADGRNIIELNGEPVFNSTEMKSYDVLTIGNTKMMLVALCGDKFNWVDGAVNG